MSMSVRKWMMENKNDSMWLKARVIVMIWRYTNTDVSFPSDTDSKEKYHKESDIGRK